MVLSWNMDFLPFLGKLVNGCEDRSIRVAILTTSGELCQLEKASTHSAFRYQLVGVRLRWQTILTVTRTHGGQGDRSAMTERRATSKASRQAERPQSWASKGSNQSRGFFFAADGQLWRQQPDAMKNSRTVLSNVCIP